MSVRDSTAFLVSLPVILLVSFAAGVVICGVVYGIARLCGWHPRAKGKRAVTKKRKGRSVTPRPTRRSAAAAPHWAQIAGEALLIALVVLVPIVINPRSRNLTDVKDVTLGLGVAAGLGLWLVAGLAQGRLGWVRSRLNLLVLAFVGWAAISILYAQFRYVAVSEFGRLAANVGIYLLAVTFLRTSRQMIRVAVAAVLGSVPVSIYAFAQAAGKDFMSYTLGTVVRVFSFLGNPTFLGGYLILLIPVAIAIAWPKPREDAESGEVAVAARTVGIGLTALMMLIALYFSFTIGGAIGLGLGTAVAVLLAIMRGGRKALRVGVPAVAAGVLLLALLGLGIYRVMPAKQQARVQKVLHFQDPYAKERQLHWRTAFGIFREAPVLGRGYGNFRAVALERMATEWYLQQPERRQGMLAAGYAHNEYLQALADIGLVGGLLFLVMLLAALALAVRVYWQTEDAGWRHFGLAVLVAFIAFLFQNFFGVTFRQTGSVTFFWLWLGALALAGASLQRKDMGAGAARVPLPPPLHVRRGGLGGRGGGADRDPRLGDHHPAAGVPTGAVLPVCGCAGAESTHRSPGRRGPG
jgi:O-antigen ligase